MSIAEKDVRLRSGELAKILLWDLNGEDEFVRVQDSYLRGASAGLLVVDACRLDKTLDVARHLGDRLQRVAGDVPTQILCNKVDLLVPADEVLAGQQDAASWLQTSAKTGTGVDQAMVTMVERALARG